MFVIWIIMIVCIMIVVVGIVVFVVLGVYKIGKFVGKLKKVEGKVGDFVFMLGIFVSLSMFKDEGVIFVFFKLESSSNSDDGDIDVFIDEDEFDEEMEKKFCKVVKGVVGGEKKKSKSKSKSKVKKVKDDDWEWFVYDEWWFDIIYRLECKL